MHAMVTLALFLGAQALASGPPAVNDLLEMDAAEAFAGNVAETVGRPESARGRLLDSIVGNRLQAPSSIRKVLGGSSVGGTARRATPTAEPEAPLREPGASTKLWFTAGILDF